ncbi:hypothetical protein PtA15_18A251 [Puccinia triticina]|uniref:Uncharacterized protein n=1 Tax=Puccinia triticina TaxID=208348 RepID=A0ABY7D9B5_9BASI|nr:uncharacterized protein PtA15_18A251 [Puccinia triticina]WAQ93193.1 hypothetical protein PtA15_18A251 [Puccinia triticina]
MSPWFAEAGVKEPSNIEPDMFGDWPPLTPLGDPELHNGFRNPHSYTFSPLHDPLHSHGELLLPHEFPEHTPSIASPLGEHVNSMIVNEAIAYKEPVEQASNRDEIRDCLLGKRPRAEPTGEVDTPLEQAAPKRSKRTSPRDTLVDLSNVGIKDVRNIRSRALTRLKNQDREDAKITQEYEKRIRGQLQKIALPGPQLKRTNCKNLPITIYQIPSATPTNEFIYQMKPNKSLIRPNDKNSKPNTKNSGPNQDNLLGAKYIYHRTLKIFQDINLYSNFLSVPGHYLVKSQLNINRLILTSSSKEKLRNVWSIYFLPTDNLICKGPSLLRAI